MNGIGVIRVLAIDGGGLRGIVPLVLLERIEAALGGAALHECFDLIAGTSTGGLIALGLGCRAGGAGPRRPRELLEIYFRDGARIFPPGWWGRDLLNWLRPKYSARGIEAVLRELFGEATLADALLPLLIASYDLTRQAPFFFKSHGASAAPGWRLRDVGRATSAAPTYLPACAVRGPDGAEHVFVDGGIVANDPVVAAFAEAAALYPEAREVHLVSLGTGNAQDELNAAKAIGWGKLQWATRIVPVMMDGVSESDDYEAARLTARRGDRFWRLQPELPPGLSAMDDSRPQTLEGLAALAAAYADANAGQIAEIAAALVSRIGA